MTYLLAYVVWHTNHVLMIQTETESRTGLEEQIVRAFPLYTIRSFEVLFCSQVFFCIDHAHLESHFVVS